MHLNIFTPLELFIIVHFIGDFVLQNKWMAFYKNGSLLRRGVHSFVYAIVFLPLLLYYPMSFIGLKLFILFLSHFIIDNEKIIIFLLNKIKKIKPGDFNEAIWRIIILVTDQLYHFLFILIILMF
ncbi:MAG: DUF3307 domain-containing protein [Parcubacteria group bacterium]|nr:DUF3307 domain-containing protein [Parcubacteria group bacterium]